MTRADSNKPAKLQETAIGLKFQIQKNIIQSRQRKTKTLISLYGSAADLRLSC